MKKFWFSGLWISLPLGLILAFIYKWAILNLRGMFVRNDYFVPLKSIDYQIMVGIVLVVMALFFLANVKRKLWDHEDNFSPFKQNFLSDISEDKNKAQRHPVPNKFLSKKPCGLTIGRYGSKYVRLPFLDSPEHQLILGSPGSGKSTTLLNGLIHNYNFAPPEEQLRAVLAIDAKPELSRKSVDECRRDIRIINPTTYGSCGFDVWHGLNQHSSDDELKERAEMIARALIPNLSGDNAHFSGNAQKILSGFLMYGFRKGYSFTDSIIEVMNASVGNLIAEILEDPDMEQHPKILHKVKSFDGNDSDEFASIKDTLEKDLDIFDVDTVQYCFSENPDKVTPDDLAKGISVYLAIPDHLLDQYKTVFGMIIEICMKHLMSIPEEILSDERPIWCLVDEGGTIYVPSLLDVASRGRSKKIQLTVVAQSFSQLEDLYGVRKARSIMDCCKTTIVFSCNDTRTAKDLSAWTGTYRESKVSTTARPGLLSATLSQNESEEFRAVMDVSDIKNLEKNDEVLVFAKGDWFLVKKAPFFTIRQFGGMSDLLQARNARRLDPHRSDNRFQE